MISIIINIIFFLTILFTLHKTYAFPKEKGTFSIDYDHDIFLLNGNPFHYVAGSIHYPRILPSQWSDRLSKMAAAGLDAISTYVTWNVHEGEEGQYNFQGQNNLTHFLELSQKHDLYVILRAGPYICAEWEFGGFPAWLLSDNETMQLRTMDKKYISAVDKWLKVLLPIIKPFLIQNGGPIISIQLENEYGSYDACDHAYMDYLASTFRRYLGDEVVLFTTDGSSDGMIKCGSSKLAYATVDFGTTNDVKEAFKPMRKFNPQGPLVNSELYAGWLDYWGGDHSRVSTDDLISTIHQAYSMKASINLYMFEGGSTFGFMSGVDPGFKVVTTSYDYNAPLTEAGDITDKYLKIRSYMQQYKPKLPAIPPNSQKMSLKAIDMTAIGSISSLLDILSSGKFIDSILPLNMEQMKHYYGFAFYRHTLAQDHASSLMTVKGLADRAYVLIDGQPIGILDRSLTTSIILSALKGQLLDLIVENLGRVSYSAEIRNGKKGILGNVTLGDKNLTQWRMYPLFKDACSRDGGISSGCGGGGRYYGGSGGSKDDGGYEKKWFKKLMKISSRKQRSIRKEKINSNLIFKRRKWILKKYIKNNYHNKNDFIYNNNPTQTIYNNNNPTPTIFNNNNPTPTIYTSIFTISTPTDTFIDTCGWSRGVIWVNGFNIGRYRPKEGPQTTLYLPADVLRGGGRLNEVMVLEMEGVRGGSGGWGRSRDGSGDGGDYIQGGSRVLLDNDGGGSDDVHVFETAPEKEKERRVDGGVKLRFVNQPQLDSKCF